MNNLCLTPQWQIDRDIDLERGSLTQLVEYLTFNQRVTGSSPVRPTIASPSSSGLGLRPLTPATGVQTPLGTPRNFKRLRAIVSAFFFCSLFFPTLFPTPRVVFRSNWWCVSGCTKMLIMERRGTIWPLKLCFFLNLSQHADNITQQSSPVGLQNRMLSDSF